MISHLLFELGSTPNYQDVFNQLDTSAGATALGVASAVCGSAAGVSVPAGLQFGGATISANRCQKIMNVICDLLGVKTQR